MPLTPEQLALKAGAFLGERILTISAPGGRRRASLAAETATRRIVITVRPELRRIQVEARVLELLSARTDLCPAFIGFDDGILYQEQIAGERLGKAIRKLEGAARREMAGRAVASLFALQEAGHAEPAFAGLPALGISRDWLDGVASGIFELARTLRVPEPTTDRATLAAALVVEPARFIRWDGRAGNAMLSPDGRVRWFDFEYASRRHGAEDFAWLIGDETWPVEAQTMFDLVRENWPAARDQDPDAFMDYLALYTAVHAVQRILLILREVKRRGWRPTQDILRRDLVGVRPDMAMVVTRVARVAAARHPLTQGFEATLAGVEARFAALLEAAVDVAPRTQ